MTQPIHSTKLGASPATPANRFDLEQTIASDLPYTHDGLLDFGALCRSAESFGSNARINRMQQAVYGCSTVVRVLHAGDDAICSMNANVRGGLLSALTVMLGTLSADIESMDKETRAQGKGGAA